MTVVSMAWYLQIISFGSSLSLPLLSDQAGKLASRFSLFDFEERINMRAVVIADNMGIALEVINISMDNEEMAEYTLDLVKQILQHRSSLLDKNCRFQEVHRDSTEQNVHYLLSPIATLPWRKSLKSWPNIS